MNSEQAGSVAVGDSIGPYRVVRLLRQGPAAIVVEAIRDDIGKRAAIKVLDPLLSRESAALTRFVNEARVVNLIGHPDIVNVFEFGRTASGSAFIAMDYLDGCTLATRLAQRRKLPIPEAVRLGQQLAAALLAVHHKGIVHRDVKPSNIMLVADPAHVGGERVKLLDFGIAKLAAPEQDEPALTLTGTVLGTPSYMAPEQCRGTADVSAAADVYALGIILYEMLAGRPPFVAALPFDLMNSQVYRTPPPLREIDPALPQELTMLVHAMLTKEPGRRPPMELVVRELGRLAELPFVATAALPRRSLRGLNMALAAVVIFLGLAGLWTAKQPAVPSAQTPLAQPKSPPVGTVKAEPSPVPPAVLTRPQQPPPQPTAASLPPPNKRRPGPAKPRVQQEPNHAVAAPPRPINDQIPLVE